MVRELGVEYVFGFMVIGFQVITYLKNLEPDGLMA
jgi:hypothetical protein